MIAKDGTTWVYMVTVTDDGYWDWHGWDNQDAVGAMFTTLVDAQNYRVELQDEYYEDQEVEDEDKTTPEQFATITECFVNDTP